MKNEDIKDFFNRLVKYFLQGLLLIAPIFLTFYSIFAVFNYIDSAANALSDKLFDFHIRGLGFFVTILAITAIGIAGSSIFAQPLMNIAESLLERTPVVKDVYTSMRDFFSAFLSNKKKFNKPVIVEMGKGLGIYRLGFITDANLAEFDISDKVAVYFPHSYNVSGNLYVVNKDQVQPLPTRNGSAETMKYIVTGGVMEIEEKEKQNEK